MDGHKRKRDDEGTIVTFYAPNRTFARVYKGQSLNETRDLVRRKLGLSDDSSIRFARLHEGKVIELEDEDDFEAFRHLARYVTSLDVSVFVGQDYPPIFTEQSSREASTNPGNNKKRSKKPHPSGSSSVIPPRPASSSRSSVAEPSPRLQAMASTIDANGVPKKKRRKDQASVESTLLGEPSAGSKGDLPSRLEEPSREVVAEDQHRSPPVSSIVAPQPFSTDNVAPSSADAAAAPRGSKRKRRDSPEPSHSTTGVSSSSSPPRMLSKKKKHKHRAIEDTVAPVEETTTGRTVKPDKKSKRKGRDGSQATESLLDVQSTSHVAGGETSGAKKAAKKAKKNLHETEGAQRHVPGTEPAPSEIANESKKRKHKGALNLESLQVDRALSSDFVQDSTSRLAPTSEDLADAIVSSVTSSSTEATTKKEKAGKRSKSKVRQGEQNASALAVDTVDNQEPALNPSVAVGPVQASVDGKESKRRQTTQMANVAGEPAPNGENTAPHAEHVQPEVASSKKAKLDRKKSTPASSEDSKGPPPDAMTALQAAFEAVMARGPSASSVDSSAPKPIPLLAPPVPARKRNAGKSKLSKVWGPDDLTVDQQPSVSAPPSAAVHIVSTASEPTSVVDPLAKTQTKTAKAKKARSSSAPACPVCEQAYVHPRSECPVITAGAPSLRLRIAQLEKDEGNRELVKELLIILKQVQRRRKTTAYAPPVPSIQIPPATTPPGDVPPSSPELPLQSLSTVAPKRPSLPNRSLSGPRLPAGSEISEVAVESKDEGSSNESSSSDDEHEAPAPSVPASATDPDGIDLQALLWGPVKPRSSILAQIPSSSESDSDAESGNSKDEDVDLEEEDKNDRAFRRMSRKFERAVSSSDDEREPEPEPANPDMDVDDIVIPPTTMDPDPNNSVEDAREVEADVLAREDSAPLRDTAGSDKQESDEEKDVQELTEEERREILDDPDADDEESGEDEAVSAKPASERAGSPASESGESHAGSGPDAESADRGGLNRIERAAEDVPLVSQETPHALAEDRELAQPKDAGAEQEESDDDAVSGEGQPAAETSVQVDGSKEGHARTAPDEPVTELMDGDTSEHRERERSPVLDSHAPTSPAHVEEDEDVTTTAQVDVVEPHSEDPNDPIDSFSSVGGQERRDRQEAEDSIEDFDTSQPQIESVNQTPPPATPRTPRTVSRMKDRYGRLPQARAKDNAPPLSEQLLGDLVLPAAELTLSANPDAGQPQHAPEVEGVLEEEAGAGEDGEDAKAREVTHEEEELPEPGPEMSQDSRESSQPQQGSEGTDARPRRTTRATQRTSTMPPPSSLPEPIPPPAPAPPQRGRRRLTEEEKAQREAEKLEKKAERERKAAEKKAEREAKAAAKRAETEARKAAKIAEKEAKDAAQRALQEEVAKRGARATRGRGRGRGGKPTSTRSQRSVASVDEPEEVEGVAQEGEPQASERVSETPAVGKISWATLSQADPRTQTESVADVDSSMVDELQPSSPELVPQGLPTRGRKMTTNEDTVVEEPVEPLLQGGSLDVVTPKPKAAKEPLFIPSSSQVPTRFELPDAESTPFADNDPHESGSEVEQDQEKTLKGSRPRPSWFAQAMYPTLTDLASQQLFPASQIPSPALFSQTPNLHASRKLVPAQYSKGAEDEDRDASSDEEDDTDSSDSDSEKNTKNSHIPQNRRAGATVQTKKKSGLLSAYK
ncbi:hypothetical protein C8T65DRAFT_741451 [Cerioporus squamosus]|nr:hypothetical protein C8T65DRAFT_741451 [Cerioporus squamosus]